MDANAGDGLPVEIYNTIAAFCARETLPALALVNKEFQVLAERHLYKTIVIQTFIQPVGALETLASSVIKASYVRFLSIEFCSRALDSDLTMVEWVLRATPSMTNLRDLRIKLQSKMRKDFTKFVGDLDEILCGGHFQLTTLIVDRHLDVEGIIDAQRDLKVLGIYAEGSHNGPLAELPSLEGRSLLVFELAHDRHLPGENRIVLYPDFLSWGQAQSFDSTFGRVSETDAMIKITTNPSRVVTAVIYLETSPMDEAFQSFMKSALKTFAKVNRVEFHLTPNLLHEWRKIPLQGSSVTWIELWKWDQRTGREELLQSVARRERP